MMHISSTSYEEKNVQTGNTIAVLIFLLNEVPIQFDGVEKEK